MRCVAQWLSPVGEETTFHPDECWAVRRGQSHPPVNGEPDIACYHLPASRAESALCVPLIAQGEAIGLLSFQNITADNAPSRAYLELMAEALGLALANQRLRDALLEKRCLTRSPACVTVIIWKIRCKPKRHRRYALAYR